MALSFTSMVFVGNCAQENSAQNQHASKKLSPRETFSEQNYSQDDGKDGFKRTQHRSRGGTDPLDPCQKSAQRQDGARKDHDEHDHESLSR